MTYALPDSLGFTRITSLFVAVLMAVSMGTAPSTAMAQKKKSSPPVKIRLPASVREGKVDMKVAQVIAGRRDYIASVANRVDSFVEQKLISEKQYPNDLASDEVFLRRLYLDVAGRIPTLQEAQTFLDSADPDRRMNLIDQLLGSPDYVSNMYNMWADTFRLVERPQNNIVADPYLAYVKDSIRTNKKYDKWVYEMLTADGKTWENPAVGFQLRDDGMPLPYIDNTVRVFLGTQIGCAQCHDHPFDEWTQYQFYELAAFTTGTRTRIQRGSPGYTKSNPANDLINAARKKYPNGRIPGELQRMIRANSYSVSEVDASLRLPHDYAYTDAKPKDVVEPAVLWGEIPTSAGQSSPREKFAAWVTSPKNEQFSRTVVNRIWKRLLGIGFVEPVDDFNPDNEISNEPLLEYLSVELIRSDFNLQELMRMILYSKTYQRESSDYELTSGEIYHFPGPAVRRMTAEQVWDSILTLAVHNPWPFQRPTAEEMAPVINIDFGSDQLANVQDRYEKFAETYSMGRYKRNINKHSYQGNVLCRASELPSPVAADHFLQQFGQGNRETIDTSQTDATVPQILAMFNGPITHVMLEPGSAIVDNVLAIDNKLERIDAIFLSVVTRKPRPTDRPIIASELSKTRNDNVGYGNIIWGLLNTREFLFVQ